MSCGVGHDGFLLAPMMVRPATSGRPGMPSWMVVRRADRRHPGPAGARLLGNVSAHQVDLPGALLELDHRDAVCLGEAAHRLAEPFPDPVHHRRRRDRVSPRRQILHHLTADLQIRHIAVEARSGPDTRCPNSRAHRECRASSPAASPPHTSTTNLAVVHKTAPQRAAKSPVDSAINLGGPRRSLCSRPPRPGS